MEGAAYFKLVNEAYTSLEQATSNILGKPNKEMLTIYCGISFGFRWLMTRNPLFMEKHPNIDLRVLTPTASWGARKVPIDVEVRFGAAD